MATSMTVICLITVKQSSKEKNYVHGSAIYCATTINHRNFDFKFYNNSQNKDIQQFEEGDIVVFTGKFSYRNDFDGDNPLFVYIYLL